MTSPITQDWQARLVERDLLLGRGTNYPGIGGIGGIGISEPDRNDVTRSGDGDAFGINRRPSRVITIPIKVLGTDVWATYRALAVGWRRSTVDLTLDLRIPGTAETVVTYFGRPQQLPGDPHGLKGNLATIADFRADPMAYGASRTQYDGSSPLVIAAADAGDPDALSTRAALTVVGNGGTPVISSDVSGSIVFAGPFASTAVIDLHAQTTTVSSVAADQLIAPTSDWFGIVGGSDNTITFTGCASVSLTWRPAYEVP